MRVTLANNLRKTAILLIKSQDGESPYLNIPFYQQRLDPSDNGQAVGLGPPSMYNDIDKKDKSKNEEDMRRQGPHPGPVDSLINQSTLPVTVMEHGNPKEDIQGELTDNAKVRSRPGDDDDEDSGLDNNRETLTMDPGTM